MSTPTYQKELFDGASSPSRLVQGSRYAFLERYSFKFRLDQILVGLFGFIVLNTIAFTFGVEHGKRSVENQLAYVERLKPAAVEADILPEAATIEVSKDVEPIVMEAKPVEIVEKAKVAETPVSPEKQAAVVAKVIAEAEKDTTPKGKYTIQLITYLTPQAAHKKISSLEGNGYQGFIIPSGKYQQVCVNAFQSRQEAKSTLSKLKAEGLAPADAYVRSIPA